MPKAKTKNIKNTNPLTAFHLRTRQDLPADTVAQVGVAYTPVKEDFPALDGVTCYTLELWEESMRIPHWHPNASELGYVISGTIEIIIWRSPGETAMFTLGPGMCWFIPKAALHSLNNIGDEHARLLVGFSCDTPQDIDMPVAFNGIPAPIRNAYTSPHAELKKWRGLTDNLLVGACPVQPALHKVITGSPYGFDLAKVTPLFSNSKIGSVTWGVKSNWNILQEISVLRAILKPGVARDPIWYPDAGTLYVVAKGKAQFHIIIAGHEPAPFNVETGDYIYVPSGVLHTFINTARKEDLEMIAFFTQENPQPEVSLVVATAFFPDTVRQAAMTHYGTEHKSGDPLAKLKYTKASPYLLVLKK
ncbi:MAG: cupin domain-containing protein [Pseudomonadota bacterium]